MDTRPPIPANPWKLSGKASNLQVKHSSKLHFALQLVIPAAILPAIAVGMITGYLEKWLWMGQLHYTGIFWTLLSVQWAMFAAAFVVVFFSSGSIFVRLSVVAELSTVWTRQHGDRMSPALMPTS